jgi:hypothetical protein
MFEPLDIITRDWGTDRIDLSGRVVVPFRPTEIHLKRDGAVDDKPSLCFVGIRPETIDVCFEVSLEMLNAAFGRLGYEIQEKKGHRDA